MEKMTILSLLQDLEENDDCKRVLSLISSSLDNPDVEFDFIIDEFLKGD